jgi:hypothetical protein
VSCCNRDPRRTNCSVSRRAETQDNMVSPRRRVDITSFEEWIVSVPERFDVLAWSQEGMHLWPLFKTALLGLAIVATMRQRRFGLTTGGFGWQLGVLADYFGSPLVRSCIASAPLLLAPQEGLSGLVLCCDSGGHARILGDMLISPSLDVMAALLVRRGRRTVFWFENSSNRDPKLRDALHTPAYGLAEVLADAHRRAVRLGVRSAVHAFPGFQECCQVAARHLGLSLPFLRFWITRQFNLALSIASAYDRIFSEHGRPELLLMSNSCVWSTTGLASAARKHGIPVIEVHHGVESPSATTAPRQLPHFARFNSTPNALITWEQIDRGDEQVFAAGPLGIHLGTVVSGRHPNDPPSYDRFLDLLDAQRHALIQRVGESRLRADVIVSLQPGDDGMWLEEIMRAFRGEVFFWVRRHARDSHKNFSPFSSDVAASAEYAIATSVFLPILLERADIHLTRFSAVTLEAAGLGVPTIATDIYAEDLFRERLPKDMFSIEQGPAAIVARIERLIAQKQVRVHAAPPDLNRLVSFVDSITAGHRGSPRSAHRHSAFDG